MKDIEFDEELLEVLLRAGSHEVGHRENSETTARNGSRIRLVQIRVANIDGQSKCAGWTIDASTRGGDSICHIV